MSSRWLLLIPVSFPLGKQCMVLRKAALLNYPDKCIDTIRQVL